MNRIIAEILNSPIVNKGAIGKLKNYIYTNYISNKKEAQTDIYRAEILNDFYEVFGEIDWILAAGSFLRYYRDSTMDGQDLDILIRFDDFKKVKKELAKRGYYMLAEFSDEKGRINEYKLKYKKAEIDIIFIHQDNEGLYYIGTYEDPDNKDKIIREADKEIRIVRGEGYGAYRKAIPDFETEEYEFQGMKFKSYKNIDVHLTAEYGNWKIPDSNFDFLEGPSNNKPRKIMSAKVVYYHNVLKEY